jgi:hypothetical protein
LDTFEQKVKEVDRCQMLRQFSKKQNLSLRVFIGLLALSNAGLVSAGELKGDLFWCNRYEPVFGPGMIFGDTPIIQKVSENGKPKFARYRLDGFRERHLTFQGTFDSQPLDIQGLVYFNSQLHEYLFTDKLTDAEPKVEFLSVVPNGKASCSAVSDQSRKILNEAILHDVPADLLKPNTSSSSAK